MNHDSEDKRLPSQEPFPVFALLAPFLIVFIFMYLLPYLFVESGTLLHLLVDFIDPWSQPDLEH